MWVERSRPTAAAVADTTLYCADTMRRTRAQYHYLRQLNGVNGGDTVFVRCVSVCVRVCVCAQRTSQSDLLKRVKATDFKFDNACFQGQSGPFKFFFEKGASVEIHLAEICTLTSRAPSIYAIRRVKPWADIVKQRFAHSDS